MAKAKRRNLITPVGIISYPNLYVPKAVDDDPNSEAKYSCSIIFEAGTDITDLKRAVIATAIDKWGDKAKGMIQAKDLNTPFRDDVEEKGYPAGSIFFNARSKNPPGVVSRFPDPDDVNPKTGKPRPLRISEEAASDPETPHLNIYAGCRVRISVTPFAYDVAGNKGVSFALNNVQKIDEGERLDGRAKAQDEFDADEDAQPDLSDLTEGTEADETEAAEAEDSLEDLI
jgi:hypothetical protein